MIIDYYSRLKYARTVAESAGLGLVEDGSIKTPYTDGKNVYVPVFNSLWEPNSNEEIYWWYALLHECYHNNFPEDFELIKEHKINMKSALGMVLNLVVDHNIEYSNYGEFEGRDSICDRGRGLHMKNTVTSINGDVLASDNSKKMSAVFVFDILCRQKWQESLIHVDLNTAINDPEVLEYTHKLNDLMDEYIVPKNSSESFELAKKIVEILDFQSEDKGDESEGGSCKGDAELSDSEAEKFGEMLGHEHTKDADERYTSKPDHRTGTYIPREVKEVNFKTGKNISFFSSRGESKYDGLEPSNSMSTAIRKYLISLKKVRYEGGRKAGRMDKRRAWRATTFAGTSASLAIRKQAIARNTVNAAVSVVVDASGSMGGRKYEHAAHSAIMLNEVFAKIGVPVEIISFTDNGEKVINCVHKEFDSRITNKALAHQFAKSSNYLADNADGESIMWAADRLMKRKETKKVMIVLSDGLPEAYGARGNVIEYTKEVVKKLEGIIDIHGIGILTRAVERFYKSNDVISDSAQLENTLLNVLKNKVLG